MPFYSTAFQDRERIRPNDRPPALGVTDELGSPRASGWASVANWTEGEEPECRFRIRWKGQELSSLFVLRSGEFVPVEDLGDG